MVMRRVGTFALVGGVILAAPLFGNRLFGTGVAAKASAKAAPPVPSAVSVKRSKADDLYLAKPEAAEAAYKAIHPHLLRFVGFQEARVTLGAQGKAAVEIVTEPKLVLEAGWESLDEHKVLASVRATRL